MYGDLPAAVSHPCSEIAFWDKDSLEKLGMLDVPLSLSGCAHIDGGRLYICSRKMLEIMNESKDLEETKEKARDLLKK